MNTDKETKIKQSGEKCPECEGSGIIIAVGVTARCCGNFNSYGSCCNNPIPEPYQYPDQCHHCEATGIKNG